MGQERRIGAKTPREIVTRLHRKITAALQMPELRERLAGFDVEPMSLSPAEFDAFIAGDIVANAALVQAAGLSRAAEDGRQRTD